MGAKSRNSKEINRATRHSDRAQFDKLRRTDPKQIVEDEDTIDELYRHLDTIAAVETRSRKWAQSGRLGSKTGDTEE